MPALPKLARVPSLRLPGGRRARGTVVGVDIEPGFVTAVQATVNGHLTIERAAGIPLDMGVVREGEVREPAALSDALRTLFRDSKLSPNVRLGLANQRTVLRTLELPPIEDVKELAAAVRFQAEDEVPMPLANAILDFHPLGIVETPDGPRQRVVLVAAQRDMVERLLDAAREAGLRPVGVDLAAFAIIRALHRREDGEGRTLYLGIGGLTNMAVAEGTVCRFTRVLGGGLEAMAEEVAARRELPVDQARDLLFEVGLSTDPPEIVPSRAPAEDPLITAVAAADRAMSAAASLEEDPYAFDRVEEAEEPVPALAPDAATAPLRMMSQPPSPRGPRDLTRDDVRMVLAAQVRDIAGEVRNSLDFQQAQDGGERVSCAVLSGPALEIPGFAAHLERELGLTVREGLVASPEARALGPVTPHRVTVAAGLATEEAPS